MKDKRQATTEAHQLQDRTGRHGKEAPRSLPQIIALAAMHYHMALRPFDVVCVKNETQPLCSAILVATVLAEHAACSKS